MISIPWLYALFALGVACFAMLRSPRDSRQAPRYAAAVYFGAMALLPAEAYHHINPDDVVPPWIIGVLIPTPFFWLHKAWIAALAALVVALRYDWSRFAAFRPGKADIAIALFCGWPLVQAAFFVKDPNPPTIAIVALLIGNWGIPWLLGRIYFNRRHERTILIDALVLFSLLLIPVAVIEGASDLRVHQVLYGPHPFDADGVERYIGYRPLAFFEHGNQYGIWMAVAAVAAWWRARFALSGDARRVRWLVAVVLLAQAIASQSVGAIGLMAIAIVWLEVASWLERYRWLYRASLLTLGTAGGLLISGKLTLAGIGATTERIQWLVGFFSSIGRQSLQWRIGRGLENLPQLKAFMLTGRGRWDWYTEFRPWDMALMLVGYFGLAGLLLVTLAITSAIYKPSKFPAAPRKSSRYAALAIVGMTMGDALMNTYVFVPSLIFPRNAAPIAHHNESA